MALPVLSSDRPAIAATTENSDGSRPSCLEDVVPIALFLLSLARSFVHQLPPSPRRVSLSIIIFRTHKHISVSLISWLHRPTCYFFILNHLSPSSSSTHKSTWELLFFNNSLSKKGKEKKKKKKRKKKTPPPHTKKVSFFFLWKIFSLYNAYRLSEVYFKLTWCALPVVVFYNRNFVCGDFFLLLTISYCRVCGFISPSSGNCFHWFATDVSRRPQTTWNQFGKCVILYQPFSFSLYNFTLTRPFFLVSSHVTRASLYFFLCYSYLLSSSFTSFLFSV